METGILESIRDMAIRLQASLRHRIVPAARRNTTSPSPISRFLATTLAKLNPVIESRKHQQKLLLDPRYRHVTNMTLVSKQFRSEFLTEYVSHADMAFMLDASSLNMEAPLRMKADLLRSLRRCQLKIIATPGLANAFDPRDARVCDWKWRDAVFLSMRQMTGLKSMSVTILASGNHLWNPIWLWNHFSACIRSSEILAFNRIDFTMKSWPTMGKPNHMRRSAEAHGGWEWHCEEGHFVVKDVREESDVRKFSNYLYARCRACEGEEQSDSDDDF